MSYVFNCRYFAVLQQHVATSTIHNVLHNGFSQRKKLKQLNTGKELWPGKHSHALCINVMSVDNQRTRGLRNCNLRCVPAVLSHITENAYQGFQMAHKIS